MRIKIFFTFFLLFTSTVFATDHLDETMIKRASDWISKYTEKKDFEKATKYYFQDTKFYSHEIIDGKEVVQVSSIDEVLPLIKQYFQSSDIEILEDIEISVVIEISPDKLKGSVTSESISILLSNKNKYKSHSLTTLVFGLSNGNIVLLESHDKNISFEQM
ncbi:MAG: hypothetical protein HRT37_23645 [Alteromonadaceae bacterium]|nr:hypothetical protein [Alteromonadaceae bacterium]